MEKMLRDRSLSLFPFAALESIESANSRNRRLASRSESDGMGCEAVGMMAATTTSSADKQHE
eukprot:5355-Eustigmatos_ZCMA.PRE.1